MRTGLSDVFLEGFANRASTVNPFPDPLESSPAEKLFLPLSIFLKAHPVEPTSLFNLPLSILSRRT